MPEIVRLWDYYTDMMQRANKLNLQRRVTTIPPKEAGKPFSAIKPNAHIAVLAWQSGDEPTCRTAWCWAGCLRQQGILPYPGPRTPKGSTRQLI